MPPIVSKFSSKTNYKLTHTQCRAKVCIICFEVKNGLRDVANNSDYIKILRQNVGPNFDIKNPRIPTGICNPCREKYFSKSKIGEFKGEIFKIPDYLQFVVAPDNVDEPDDCAICQKVRPTGSSSGLRRGKPSPVSRGRPLKV